MGATEPVFVEQLIAKHSIEELIVNLNKKSNIHEDLYSETCKSNVVSEHYPEETYLIQNNGKFCLQNVLPGLHCFGRAKC